MALHLVEAEFPYMVLEVVAVVAVAVAVVAGLGVVGCPEVLPIVYGWKISPHGIFIFYNPHTIKLISTNFNPVIIYCQPVQLCFQNEISYRFIFILWQDSVQ